MSSYSSLNTIRSAISLIFQNEIGNHPLIKRFCKGVAILKPPRPRYDYVWDPAPVIAQLASIYSYDSVDLKRITKKLVILLALGTGHRVQTLSSIRISQLSLKDKLIIRIPDRIKTTAPGRAQSFFCSSHFTDHENLCIVRLTEVYLERIKNLRSSTCDFLFISTNKPYKAVTTISQWIFSGFAECGVDTNMFSAHSTRHVSTSRAAEKGVSIDLIKHAASWIGESRVFATFYNRPIVNPEDYSNTVLLS